MPLISQIGRRHASVRALREAIFIVLLVGALTMVYPFLLMLAGSTKSSVDARENSIVPRFLFDDTVLYRKHIEAMYDERLDAMRAAYDEDVVSFAALRPPARPNEDYVALWREFLRARPVEESAYTIGHVFSPNTKTAPLNFRAFKREMMGRTGGDIARLNREYETEFVNWNAFMLMTEDRLSRRSGSADAPLSRAFAEFKGRQPDWWRVHFLADGFYKNFLRAHYSRDIAKFNAEHGTNHRSYDEIRLTRQLPDGTPREKKDWEDFVSHTLNPMWVRDGKIANTTFDFQDFLRARFADLAALNSAIWSGDSAADNADDADQAGSSSALSALSAVKRSAPHFRSFDDVRPPVKDAQYLDFLAHRGELRREFATRNYATVIDYLLLHGRGMRNTAIYCLLAMVVALTFNPLAAYALSRYRPPSQYRILLFLLLTMAFPPMVTQIPVFLMLRDWNLLNTFAALILPGLVHGYSIFLLKGFFDSQPRELYESAQIDGAGEWTIFWQITMSLSKPILSVIALNAFTSAYSNFLFALLTCQDENMWTLMVWLYQLQQRSGIGVTHASLILAALPTFAVFVACQKIILRGIVVPSEK